MNPSVQSFAVAFGLVVVALLGLVIVWKVTKSLLTLVFWLVAALLVLLAAWWLLARQGILPPIPGV